MGYIIYFHNCIDTTTNAEISFNIKLGGTYKLLKKSISAEQASIVLAEYEFIDIKFHKEIYRPGEIEFTLQIKKEKSVDFKGTVDLAYDNNVVAKNYYIFEKKVKKEYVTFKAYSVDKFLTFDKFNQSFTGKKFVCGIVKTVLNTLQANSSAIKMFKTNIDKDTESENTAFMTFDNADIYNKDAEGLAVMGVFSRLNHLIYGTSDSVKLKNKDGSEEEVSVPVYKEYILPYSVQYNESFYDFLVRMCNRYGEFLYCENNRLYIGLESSKTVELGTDVEDSEAYESCVDFETVSALDVPNYFENTDIKASDLINNEGIVAEDYFHQIEKKDYAVMSDYTPPVSTAFDLLTSFGEAKSLYAGVLSAGIKAFLKFSISGKFMGDINDKYTNLYFGKNLDPECCNADETKKNEFATWGKYINNDWYLNILKGERKSEKGKMIVKYTTYHDYLLGDKVIANGKSYIVYSVKGGKEQDKSEFLELLMVPIQADDNKVYPLPMEDLHIRKSEPQRAIVVSNFDPERLGRVCVKYPWQYMYTGNEAFFNEQDDKSAAALVFNMQTSTPWIRVSYPMASKESGFMFLPAAGDEVLIDYEGGNIERPFVAGSFYTGSNKPSVPAALHTVGLTKSITSANGHHISFTDPPGGARFIADLIPFYSLLSKFGVGADWKASDLGKYLSGGFEIADFLGVYSISGSTHGRNISIKSPVGDVKIDAFTGITINAPLGDVKIVGKNVEIEARNNLTITSGSNIKQPYFVRDWANKESWAMSALGMLPNVIGGIMKIAGLDLSFHRTWLEVFLRPIGGTMLIKSYRFLCLEAGDGNADISLSDGERNEQNIINSLTEFVERVKLIFLTFSTIREKINKLKKPKDFLIIVTADIDYQILQGIVKENISSVDDINEKFAGQGKYNNASSWVKYLNEYSGVKAVFDALSVDIKGMKNDSLNKLLKEYERAIDKLKKDLLDNNMDERTFHVHNDYDMNDLMVRKRILFNAISDYISKDELLKKLYHMDCSKVNDWTNANAIAEGLIPGPSNTTKLKLMTLAPVKNSLAFFDFSDDKWWKELNQGGIVYSVSKLNAKVISKRGNGEFVEEIKINKNANLSRTIQQNIIGQVLNLNLNN